MYEFIKRLGLITGSVYMDEAVTESFKSIKSLFGESLVGAEFLGSDKVGGKIYDGTMHQNSTALTFEGSSFNLIISQHVLDHIYDYKKALQEYLHIFVQGGVFAIIFPFFMNSKKIIMRAELYEGGSIHHILPPEIHGNPLSASGALAFYNHG